MDNRSTCKGQTLQDADKPMVTDREQYAFAIGNADARRTLGLD
ncbi:MAG TPA: hypothetical protein VFA40_20060 [Terriglobales bacterium]|nr:hypothetical protein [Terriglobales bacterium]